MIPSPRLLPRTVSPVRSRTGTMGAAVFLASLVAACTAGNPGAERKPPTPVTSVRVYKDPSCGCCNAWVSHMRDNGFSVATVDEPSQSSMDSLKAAHGVTPATASCHTAEAGGYVIEGHVPADLVQRLLREHPTDVRGLAVPGMVAGSPGMETEGSSPEHYTVVAIMRDGSTRPYASR